VRNFRTKVANCPTILPAFGAGHAQGLEDRRDAPACLPRDRASAQVTPQAHNDIVTERAEALIETHGRARHGLISPAEWELVID
jgi:hypothetical protein